MTDLNLRGRDIVNLLRTKEAAVARALIVLNEFQTADEQAVRRSRHENEQGFTKADAKKGTEHAYYFAKNGYLTDEMLAYWRAPVKNTNGKPTFRIAIYWRQLLQVAYRKHHAQERLAQAA
jgi:hypothetical protein